MSEMSEMKERLKEAYNETLEEFCNINSTTPEQLSPETKALLVFFSVKIASMALLYKKFIERMAK